MICNFCDEKLIGVMNTRPDDPCCDDECLINDEGRIVRRHCGCVIRYDPKHEYYDFHENMYKTKKKSIYRHKYHIHNVLDSLCRGYVLCIKYDDRCKKCSIFRLIKKVLPRVNGDCKRMINIRYVLIKLFDMLRISYDDLPIPKTKKTLEFYDRLRNDIERLIGNDIKRRSFEGEDEFVFT